MVLESQRKNTSYTERDNMLDIWQHITQLSFRGFGIKKRKQPKIPRNFNKWSEKSRARWQEAIRQKLDEQERYDMMFVQSQTRVLDNLCREIVYILDRVETLGEINYLCEWENVHMLQEKAIGRCNNLKRELNHIANTIPCNKNFLALQTEDIDKEIQLLYKWKKSYDNLRQDIIKKEISSKKTIAEQLEFINCSN